MRTRRVLAAALAGLLGLGPAASAADSPKTKDLCPRVRIVGDDPGLNEVEKRLVCGNEEGEGWKKVPLNEAEYFLRAFLQRRGYHYPRFEAQNETLTVLVGTKTIIKELTGTGLEGLYDLGKKRLVRGNPLTPAELDKLKSDVSTRLQEQGYACPNVKITADARKGEIHLDVAPGIYYILTYVHSPEVDHVDPGVFERFRAHQYGYPFDIRLLNLTSERIVQEALFQSAYYDVNCSTNGLQVTQRIVTAKPRLVTIGFGLDTEGYARARVRWRHSRIGWRASSAEATLFSSFREQEFDTFMRYYLRPSDRIHLIPRITARRENEVQFETREAKASLHPAWTWDDVRLHLEVEGGPAIEYFNTARGVGPSDDTFAAFDTRVLATSHLFEYYQRDPREGWQASLQTSHRVRTIYSAITSNRLRVFGEKLWNAGNYDPPWLVVATRGWAGTLAVSGDRTQAFTLLPPSERFYLGGDADLRGANRKELPYDGLGFISAAYGGVEARVNDVLPYKLQPLLFVDGGMGGRREFQLDRDIYWSPGAGMRWASPFGAFRFTFARGMVARRSPENPTKLPHWQFFVSFGSEF